MKKLFLITGMHRSGTSCVANLLFRLGVDFGSDPALSKEKLDNKYGNWEDRTLVEVNDALLRFKQSFWFDPMHFVVPERLDQVPEYVEKKIDKITEHFSKQHNIGGLKDPRLSLTLPFWKTVFYEYELTVIYVFRRPELVAHSLASRNSFPFEYGLALWEYYIRAAADGSKGITCKYVSFDELLSNPERVTRKLAQEIELDVTAKVIAGAAESVVKPKASRADYLVPALPDQLDNLYDTLTSSGLENISTEVSGLALEIWRGFVPIVHARFMQKQILFLSDRFFEKASR